MKRKKVMLALLLVVVVAVAGYFMMIPDVRNRPLSTREFMLRNPDFGDTVALFELRRGHYEFNLYYYHFGERVVVEPLNSAIVIDRTEMVGFYTHMTEDKNINFGMRTTGWHADTIFILELGEYSAQSWRPVSDYIRNLRVGEEQALMTYQFDTSSIMRIMSVVDFSEFGEQIEDFRESEHIVIITITRVELDVT